MKLELKHLAGYLPYGLPARLSNEGIFNLDSEYPNDHKNKVGYISNFNWYNGEFAGELKISKKFSFDFDSADEIQILLRPLSDLTKEIEVNREKFVPLLKICDFLNIHYTSFSLLDRYSIDLVLSTEYHRANSKTKEPQKIRFWFSNFNGTSFYCSNMNKLIYKDLYGAIQKLYEWHFDIYGLIEKGLAFHINTQPDNIKL